MTQAQHTPYWIDDDNYLCDNSGATANLEDFSEEATRLVAAAPDLLEACLMVFEAAEDCGDMNDIDWDQLRAAVAAATGGAS